MKRLRIAIALLAGFAGSVEALDALSPKVARAVAQDFGLMVGLRKCGIALDKKSFTAIMDVAVKDNNLSTAEVDQMAAGMRQIHSMGEQAVLEIGESNWAKHGIECATLQRVLRQSRAM